MNDKKKDEKPIGLINNLAKGVHVDLANDPIEEGTHIITKDIKSPRFNVIYGTKICLMPRMAQD